MGRNLSHSVHVVDPETGEVEYGIRTEAPVHRWAGGAFAMVGQQAALELADTNMPAMAWRLLMFILGRVDYGNLFRIEVTYLARRWGVTRRTIYNAIGKLEEMNIIVRAGEEKEGVPYTHRLNPTLAYRGNARSRSELLKKATAERGWGIINGGA